MDSNKFYVYELVILVSILIDPKIDPIKRHYYIDRYQSVS